MIKFLNMRFLIMAVVIFIGLYLLVSFLLFDVNNEKKVKDLLAAPAQIVYGKLFSQEDGLQLKLDESGEAAILFSARGMSADDYSLFNISMDGLKNNYQVLLVWTNQLNPKINEIKLPQPNDGTVVTELLGKNQAWSNTITQIGLRIIPQEHLGLSIPHEGTITIKHAELNNTGLFDNILLLKQYWFDYDSLNYRSVNHLKLNKILPVYAQPLFFIIIWSLLMLVASRIFLKHRISTQTVIIVFFIAVVFLDVIFLNNNKAISQWSQSVYVDDEKILPDEALNKLAHQVKFLLGLNDDKTDKIKNNKVLILSSDRYQRARLIYHMLPVNSSFLDENIEVNAKAKLKEGDYIVSYDVANQPKRPQKGQLIVGSIGIPVKEVAKGTNYSIMEVLK